MNFIQQWNKTEYDIKSLISQIFFFFFSTYNVWKHVQYPNLISRQPGW